MPPFDYNAPAELFLAKEQPEAPRRLAWPTASIPPLFQPRNRLLNRVGDRPV